MGGDEGQVLIHSRLVSYQEQTRVFVPVTHELLQWTKENMLNKTSRNTVKSSRVILRVHTKQSWVNPTRGYYSTMSPYIVSVRVTLTPQQFWIVVDVGLLPSPLASWFSCLNGP